MLVSPDWLKDHVSDPDVILLDTRPKALYLYGHLENSQSLSIDQVIQFDQYGSHLVLDETKVIPLFSSVGIDDSKTVVVIGDPMDPSSARIAWTLLYFGHTKTVLLDSSIPELQKHGFTFTKKIPSPKPADFMPKINQAIRIESQYLKDNLDRFTIVDARTLQEFMSGHLPKAKLIPFTDGIDHGGKLFKNKGLLNDLFLENNISKNDSVVCYCMHGHRASSLFFQFKSAGYDNIKLYDGSFVEWYGRRLPLE